MLRQPFHGMLDVALDDDVVIVFVVSLNVTCITGVCCCQSVYLVVGQPPCSHVFDKLRRRQQQSLISRACKV